MDEFVKNKLKSWNLARYIEEFEGKYCEKVKLKKSKVVFNDFLLMELKIAIHL